MLKVDLRQLERKRRLRIDELVPPDDGLWEETEVRAARPLRVQLEAQVAGHDVVVRGALEGTVVLPCRRCLTDVDVALKEDVALLFRRGLTRVEAEEQEVYTLPERGDELDLHDAIREQVMLAVPRFVICQETCRGLCPHCGTNLNQTQCDCRPVDMDERWAALRKLRTE